MNATNRLRFRFQWRAVILLALVWVLLWGDASLLNILYGALLGWLITVVFWLAPIRYYGRVHPGRALLLVVTQLKDLAVASVHLAAVAFKPKLTIRPGVVRVELRSNSDLFQVAVAQLISIVPGTLVVELNRHPRLLYLHVFDLPDAAAVEREREHALALERRVVEAFGSRADIEAVRS
ncbi:MAG TPA: Na+/H+ antiporter subunit E [Propionicimonas sp.]|nr:Na+/H+ antiporter subunit E [Propionicimonas sp.]HRA05449.1 Na+/H+ antiporter subunit E [Propionicimonas sp.]